MVSKEFTTHVVLCRVELNEMQNYLLQSEQIYDQVICGVVVSGSHYIVRISSCIGPSLPCSTSDQRKVSSSHSCRYAPPLSLSQILHLQKTQEFSNLH